MASRLSEFSSSGKMLSLLPSGNSVVRPNMSLDWVESFSATNPFFGHTLMCVEAL